MIANGKYLINGTERRVDGPTYLRFLDDCVTKWTDLGEIAQADRVRERLHRLSGPDAVNGFPVLREEFIPKTPGGRAGRVILIDRGQEYALTQRWVVAAQYRTGSVWDTGWDNGWYVSERMRADELFRERCRLSGVVL